MSARRLERKVGAGSTNRPSLGGRCGTSSSTDSESVKPRVYKSSWKHAPPINKVMVAVDNNERVDMSAGLNEKMTAALEQADVTTARHAKFAIGILRDRFALRKQFTETFRRIDTDKSNRVNKPELKKFLDALSCPLDEKAMDLVMLQIDPNGDGSVELHELTDNLLRLGAWGVHDPFMSNALRNDMSDVKLATADRHTQLVEDYTAKSALRRAVPPRALEKALTQTSLARTADQLPDLEAAAAAAGGSKATEAAKNLFLRPHDPLEGTLDAHEFTATVRSISTLNSRRAARIGPGPDGRVEIGRFCEQLGEKPPPELGWGLCLPAGDRRAVSVPRLPGHLSRYIADDDLRERVEAHNALSDARVQQRFTLTKPKEAPILIP